jgi:hypothetical protein
MSTKFVENGMNRQELERSWEVTKAHLENAKRQLLQNNQSVDEAVTRYEDWLSHNELELAWDELADIGEDLDCGRLFWFELLAAAENMSLPTEVEFCRRHIERIQ